VPWFLPQAKALRFLRTISERSHYVQHAEELVCRGSIGTRHTHGTLLHSQGTPLKVAQAQLGHSHMATTLEVYTHASVSAQREAVNLLEGQLFPNVPKFDGSGNTTQEEPQLLQ
jgi:integrase